MLPNTYMERMPWYERAQGCHEVFGKLMTRRDDTGTTLEYTCQATAQHQQYISKSRAMQRTFLRILSHGPSTCLAGIVYRSLAVGDQTNTNLRAS